MLGRILVVEDKADARRNLVWAAESFADVGVAANANEAVGLLNKQRYDLVVTDLKMEESESGMDVLRAAKRNDPHTQVIVITAFGSPDVSVRAMREGAFDYIERDRPGLDFLEMLRHKIRLAIEYGALLKARGRRL
jgi:DNA-binding NtrC family response regulator